MDCPAGHPDAGGVVPADRVFVSRAAIPRGNGSQGCTTAWSSMTSGWISAGTLGLTFSLNQVSN
jgi:hypothetical protein